jgi:two-component sensor histidine kinase
MPMQPSNPADGEPDAGDPHLRDVACDLDKAPNRGVRDLVRALLTGRAGILIEDAVLVAEELVSNAHRHGDAPRLCRLALLGQGRRLRIEVDDASPAPPYIRTPDSTGGRGLVLVNRLASAWGVQRHTHHKTVWAELALDSPGSSGHTPHMAAAPDLAAVPLTRRSR